MVKSTTFIDVRYYETDLMGIVHHSNYIRYFECGRHQCMVDLGLPINEIEGTYGIMLPVVKVECSYRKPARMGDRLRIESRIEEMPKAKLEVFSEIYNQNGELVVTGKVVLGFIHADSRKPTRIPECMVRVFSPFFEKEA